jgi:acyl dehydratase
MRLPAEPGETFMLRWRIAVDDVPRFAASVHDFNPLHHDVAAARAAGYPGLIACGPHLGGIFMGMTATHFAKPLPGGGARSGLGMGFEIRFRAPVYPDEDIDLRWTVTNVERKDRLRGWVTTLDGEARSQRALLLSGTGTLLLRLDDHAAE